MPDEDADPFAGTSETQGHEDDNDDLCDCDPEYKEVRTVQRSKGANIGPLGGRHGDGTTVIVCKNCGKRFYEDDEDPGSDPLFGQGRL